MVSLWDHHYRKGPPGTMEFTGAFSRWTGHGNTEFRENVHKAFSDKATVRLVIVKTNEVGRVEGGEDAPKDRPRATAGGAATETMCVYAGSHRIPAPPQPQTTGFSSFTAACALKFAISQPDNLSGFLNVQAFKV